MIDNSIIKTILFVITICIIICWITDDWYDEYEKECKEKGGSLSVSKDKFCIDKNGNII